MHCQELFDLEVQGTNRTADAVTPAQGMIDSNHAHANLLSMSEKDEVAKLQISILEFGASTLLLPLGRTKGSSLNFQHMSVHLLLLCQKLRFDPLYVPRIGN